MAVTVKAPAHVVDVWPFTKVAGVVKFMSLQPLAVIDPGEDTVPKTVGFV